MGVGHGGGGWDGTGLGGVFTGFHRFCSNKGDYSFQKPSVW